MIGRFTRRHLHLPTTLTDGRFRAATRPEHQTHAVPIKRVSSILGSMHELLWGGPVERSQGIRDRIFLSGVSCRTLLSNARGVCSRNPASRSRFTSPATSVTRNLISVSISMVKQRVHFRYPSRLSRLSPVRTERTKLVRVPTSAHTPAAAFPIPVCVPTHARPPPALDSRNSGTSSPSARLHTG